MTHSLALTEAVKHGAEAAQLIIAARDRPVNGPRSNWTAAVLEAAMDEAVIAAHWYHVAEQQQQKAK